MEIKKIMEYFGEMADAFDKSFGDKEKDFEQLVLEIFDQTTNNEFREKVTGIVIKDGDDVYMDKEFVNYVKAIYIAGMTAGSLLIKDMILNNIFKGTK